MSQSSSSELPPTVHLAVYLNKFPARLVQNWQSCGRFSVVTAKKRPISLEKCTQRNFFGRNEAHLGIQRTKLSTDTNFAVIQKSSIFSLFNQ